MNWDWVVVFDWDGTLIESLPLKIRNAGRLFEARFGVPAAQIEAAYRLHSGIPRRSLFDAICAEVGLPALADELYTGLSAAFTKSNREVISQLTVAAEVSATLTQLKQRGCRLYVSTSAAPDEVRDLARTLGLADFFIEILGSQADFTKGPVHIAYILAQTGADRTQIWFVGDEPSDVRLGKAAAVRTVVRSGSHPVERLAAAGPDYLIHSLPELVDLLEVASQ